MRLNASLTAADSRNLRNRWVLYAAAFPFFDPNPFDLKESFQWITTSKA